MAIAKLKPFCIFVAAIFLGTLYAGFLGLVTYPLRASLLSGPIWIILFWFAFWKFDLIRFSGYLAVVPLAILSFEVVRTIRHPPQYAFQIKSLDRSHYTRRVRVLNENYAAAHSNEAEGPVKELYIGQDGFRADPETGRGNPARCHDVLIGDSMIYGVGLPYPSTLRPVLGTMNIDGCVFGVAGNSPVDYLATLNYVANRIDDGARIAIYIYAYNDFVSLRDYLQRTIRGCSSSLVKLDGLIGYYDDWRRTTFVQGSLRAATTTPRKPPSSYRLKIGSARDIEIYWGHDPAEYHGGRPFKREERATFEFFLKRLRALVANRPWRVTIVFIPDNEEMLANLSHPSSTFQDLDPRRVEALKLCATLWSDCRDLSHYMFDRAVAEGQSPYLLKDRHFSLFGNRVLAEHYKSMAENRFVQRR
jgi:hypothetical protein